MAVNLTDTRAVEHFHLLFLAQLGTRLDKKLYALKGGCNLRFFWKSIRYSEDIDFDVHTIAKHTLQKNVKQILDASGFKQILRSSKMELTNVSEPKQTDTTQRWKIHVRHEVSGIDLPTKIEFSRRKFASGVIFGPIDPELLTVYNLRPIIISHYDLEPAFTQKIEALLHRKETQARDIFDLALLSERGAKSSTIKINKDQIAEAHEIVMRVSFDQFRGQVVAYLLPEYQDYYRSRSVWDSLQKNVARILENL
jgi:predicted nucleotidyltransferase component of viral defense system